MYSVSGHCVYCLQTSFTYRTNTHSCLCEASSVHVHEKKPYLVGPDKLSDPWTCTCTLILPVVCTSSQGWAYVFCVCTCMYICCVWGEGG